MVSMTPGVRKAKAYPNCRPATFHGKRAGAPGVGAGDTATATQCGKFALDQTSSLSWRTEYMVGVLFSRDLQQ